MQTQSIKLLTLFVAWLVLAGYCGNYHFVYGRGVTLQKIQKVSWSLSETIINVDEVQGMPAILARARYPIFLQSMDEWRRN
jgi:hypothetical protein